MIVGKAHQQFSAAHRIVGHKGRCSSLHGHNYSVTVSVRGAVDSASGMVVDFSDLKTILKAVLDCLDHSTMLQRSDPLYDAVAGDRLTLLVPFAGPPTVEAVTRWIWRELSGRLTGLKDVSLHSLTVYETADSFAEMTIHDACQHSTHDPCTPECGVGSAARGGCPQPLFTGRSPFVNPCAVKTCRTTL